MSNEKVSPVSSFFFLWLLRFCNRCQSSSVQLLICPQIVNQTVKHRSMLYTKDYSLADANWAPVHVLHFRTFFHTCPAKNRKWKQHSFQTCCLEANNNQGEANHRRKYGKNRGKCFWLEATIVVYSVYICIKEKLLATILYFKDTANSVSCKCAIWLFYPQPAHFW